MFYISGAVHIFGALFYLIFARGDVQPWAVMPDADSADRTENAHALLEKGRKTSDTGKNGDALVVENEKDSKLLDKVTA